MFCPITLSSALKASWNKSTEIAIIHYLMLDFNWGIDTGKNDCQPVKTLLDLQATFAPESTEDFEYKNNSCFLKPKTEFSFK